MQLRPLLVTGHLHCERADRGQPCLQIMPRERRCSRRYRNLLLQVNDLPIEPTQSCCKQIKATEENEEVIRSLKISRTGMELGFKLLSRRGRCVSLLAVNTCRDLCVHIPTHSLVNTYIRLTPLWVLLKSTHGTVLTCVALTHTLTISGPRQPSPVTYPILNY